MNYNKILEDLDLKLNIAQYEIDNMCDVSNFPLTKEKRKILSDAYDRREKLGNLYNKILEREDKKSIAYYEDVASHGIQEDEDDYVESEDPYIPSIHEDQWS